MTEGLGETQRNLWQLSDESLFKITASDYGDYAPEEVDAARQELKRRKSAESSWQNTAYIQTEYAGFWRRFVAYTIDSFIINILTMVLSFVFAGIAVFSGMTINEDELSLGLQFILGIIMIFVIWFYFALMESSSNQGTFGKMALGIKVTDADGNNISFGKASLRFWGKTLSAIPFGIGYIMAGFTEKKQALHDILSGCLVLKK